MPIHAIILSAGQGKRLLPLTEAMPKCLLPVGEGLTILAWQLSQLEAAGVRGATVVTGFHAGKVEAELSHYRGALKAKTLYNPFYGVADNIGSVWLAKATGAMEKDFLLLNGDTLFERAVPIRLFAEAKEPLTLTFSRKEIYDADDMKIQLDGTRLVAVRKTLDATSVDGESIGMMLFRGEGTAIFREAIERAMQEEGALKRWYLSVMHSLAGKCRIGTVEVPTESWCEVDVASDLAQAEQALGRWRQADFPKAAG